MSFFANGVYGRFCGSTFGFDLIGGVIDTVLTFPQTQSYRGWQLTITGFDSRNQQSARWVSVIVPHASLSPALLEVKPR